MPATYSGFETCVEQVGRRMVARGHQVTVHCRRGHYREGRPDTHLGMKLVYEGGLRGKHLESMTHTALSAMSLSRDEAVVCMGVGNAPLVRLLEATGRAVVFNVDGADWTRAKWSGPASRYLRACEVLAAHGRSAMVADAQVVAEHYRVRYGRATVPIAYGAEPPGDTGTETLSALGVRPGEYNLFVGRLEPENGAHDAITGAIAAGDDRPLVVVGGAPHAAAYLAELQAMRTPNIHMPGFVFGVGYQQLSAHAGIFILAAQVGGTHPVLLEQMAAGNCILARDTASHREVLGDAGLYWNSPDELARLLSNAWADDAGRAGLGAAARERQRANYDWEDATSRYLAACEEALARRSSSR
ncbi:MAG: glycosyltransferase [Candidatus Dormibacteria bacterium]